MLWRFVVAAMVLLPFAWRQIRQVGIPTLATHAGIGLLAVGGYVSGVYLGIAKGVPAGLAALIADTLPLGTAVLATFALKQSLSIRRWCFLLLGLGGVLVGAQGFGDQMDSGWAWMLPLVGMLALATASLWQSRRQGADSLGLAGSLFIQCLVGAIIFGAMATHEGRVAPLLDTEFLVSILWTGLIATVGGYGLFWACMRRSNPTRVATVLYLSPATTCIWAWMMFDDPITWPMVLGAMVSGLGIWLFTRSGNKVSAPREQACPLQHA